MSRLYSTSKVFHFHSKLADILDGRLTPPIHIRLKPTNRCNHRCSYCCYRNEDLYLSERMKEADEIPPDKMKEITNDIITMGVRAVTFSGGGDPLCYPHFLDCADRLLEGGVRVAVLTNGSRLQGAVAERLGSGATWVRISLDAANADDYAQVRQVSPREFQKVCENIENFARTKREACELGINYIVTRENHSEVFAFLRLMKDLGVDHVKVSEAVISVDHGDNVRYVRSFQETVRGQIERGLSHLADDRFRIIDRVLDPGTGPADGNNLYQKAYSWCPFIQCLTVIAADLMVYTCQDKAYSSSGIVGSIRDRSFRELWSDPITRERLTALDPSRDCVHHCVQHQKNLAILDYLDADPGHIDFI